MTTTPDGPTIRPAIAGDAAAIAELSGELGYPTDIDETARRFAALPATDAVLVAEMDGAVVGWVHVSLTRSLVVPVHGLVKGMVVAEAQRGRGIGRALMAAAEAWTLERGASRVRLRSAMARDGAHSFYERLGYAEVKTQRVFVRDLTR